MSAGVISYNDTNPAFSYQPLASWVDGHWNASNVGQTGTLHVTNSQNANVTFVRPFLLFTHPSVDIVPGRLFQVIVWVKHYLEPC